MTRLAPAVWLALIVVAGASLSGCFGKAPIVVPRFPLHAFTAKISVTGEEEDRVLTLGNPVRITDRDGTHGTAYPLAFTFAETPPQVDPARKSWFYLDGSLRVVRDGSVCQNLVETKDGECKYHGLSWRDQGDLPPLGIGWLQLLKGASSSARLDYSRWTINFSAAVQIQQESDRIILTADGPQPAENEWLDASGRYEYEPGAMIPSKITKTIRYEGGNTKQYEVQLLDYQEGPELAPADVWPKSTAPPPNPTRDGVLFPGEAQDDYLVGFTHKQALDWLLAKSPQAKSLLDGQGCLASYNLRVPAAQRPTVPLSTYGVADVSVALVDDTRSGYKWTFSWTATATPLGTDYKFDSLSQEQFEWTTGCKERTGSPWPSVTSAQFLRFTNAMPITNNPEGSKWFSAFEFHLWDKAIPPSSGWREYSRIWTPAHVDLSQGVVGYRPYGVQYEAEHGWMEVFDAHPGDVEKLDAGPDLP